VTPHATTLWCVGCVDHSLKLGVDRSTWWSHQFSKGWLGSKAKEGDGFISLGYFFKEPKMAAVAAVIVASKA